MKTFIYGHYITREQLLYLKDLIKISEELGVEVMFYRPFLEEIRLAGMQMDMKATIDSHSQLVDESPDFVITLGGDGTILQSITLVRDAAIPIIGVNMGRMGFLASIDRKSIRSAMVKIMNGRYRIEERSLLRLDCNKDIYGETRFALNDFTITKRDSSAMVKISVYINQQLLNIYWADGIIVATPTGSTGYSLSCGGPILFPDAANFVITPIAPHNLTVRPVVIRDSATVDIRVEGREETYLSTLDSRSEQISADHHIRLTKCHFNAHLAYPEDSTFMETIGSKLMWGLDIRN